MTHIRANCAEFSFGKSVTLSEASWWPQSFGCRLRVHPNLCTLGHQLLALLLRLKLTHDSTVREEDSETKRLRPGQLAKRHLLDASLQTFVHACRSLSGSVSTSHDRISSIASTAGLRSYSLHRTGKPTFTEQVWLRLQQLEFNNITRGSRSGAASCDRSLPTFRTTATTIVHSHRLWSRRRP